MPRDPDRDDLANVLDLIQHLESILTDAGEQTK